MRAFGKYRLLEPIATGGMAEVWRAEAPGAAGFVKEVALKLIRGDHDAHGDFVEMFIREARLASRLAHGNIVQVFDFDQVDGRYYIAMELVRGRTLRAVVDRCRERGVRLGVARAVHVCAEVARALAYAHRAEQGGLVHRDVSPQNVLVSFEGEVKLADFGIARVLGTGDVTAPGTVKGKLAYMAPEQARGGAVDGRADVFSVGVILWELCAGRRLFARDSDAAMLAAVIAADPVQPPSAWNEAVPPELDAIVLGALERDPEARTASAEALASALSALRLRLATDPEELDLRSMMGRLWPAGEAAATEEPPPERTAIRPAAPAAEGVAAPWGAAHDAGARRQAEPPPGSGADDAEVATRTMTRAPPPAASPPPQGVARRGRAPRLAVALGAACAIAGALVALEALGGREAPAGRAGDPPAVHDAPATVTRLDPPAAPATSPRPGVRDETGVAALAPPRAAPASGAEARREPRPSSSAASTASATSATSESAASRASTTSTAATGSTVPATAGARVTAVVETATAATAGTPTRDEAATGILAVRAVPWAYVTVDGREVGETPFEAPVSAAEHRLRAHHPTLGDDEIVVTVAAGERLVWRPRLSRP